MVATAKKPQSRRRETRVPEPSDIDLTTGRFRLDLKTALLLLGLAGSWWDQTHKVDALTDRIQLQEEARVKVEQAKKETEEARRQLDANERQQLKEAINEVKAKVSLAGLDIGDLKLAVGFKKNGG